MTETERRGWENVEYRDWRTAEDVFAYLKGKQLRIEIGNSGNPKQVKITADGTNVPTTACKVNMEVNRWHSLHLSVVGQSLSRDEWPNIIAIDGQIVDGEVFAWDDPERSARIKELNGKSASGEGNGRA